MCRIFPVALSGVRLRALSPCRSTVINEPLAARITELIRRRPTFGYRRLWALLRFREGTRITPRTVYHSWRSRAGFVHQRSTTRGRAPRDGSARRRTATSAGRRM